MRECTRKTANYAKSFKSFDGTTTAAAAWCTYMSCTLCDYNISECMMRFAMHRFSLLASLTSFSYTNQWWQPFPNNFHKAIPKRNAVELSRLCAVVKSVVVAPACWCVSFSYVKCFQSKYTAFRICIFAYITMTNERQITFSRRLTFFFEFLSFQFSI